MLFGNFTFQGTSLPSNPYEEFILASHQIMYLRDQKMTSLASGNMLLGLFYATVLITRPNIREDLQCAGRKL